MRHARIVALVGALALAASADAGTSSLATLRFLDLTPVKVRGAHFVPGEQVQVTLRAGDAKRIRTARASAGGGFAVDFGTLKERDRCSGSVAVAAVGGQGDRAAYKLASMACPAMTTGLNR